MVTIQEVINKIEGEQYIFREFEILVLLGEYYNLSDIEIFSHNRNYLCLTKTSNISINILRKFIVDSIKSNDIFYSYYLSDKPSIVLFKSINYIIFISFLDNKIHTKYLYELSW